MSISHVKGHSKQEQKVPSCVVFEQHHLEKGGLLLPKSHHPCRAGKDGKSAEGVVLLPSLHRGPGVSWEPDPIQ